MSNGNVKCPIHGEHGCSANGQCWYCVQQGLVKAKPVRTGIATTLPKPQRRVIA